MTAGAMLALASWTACRSTAPPEPAEPVERWVVDGTVVLVADGGRVVAAEAPEADVFQLSLRWGGGTAGDLVSCRAFDEWGRASGREAHCWSSDLVVHATGTAHQLEATLADLRAELRSPPGPVAPERWHPFHDSPSNDWLVHRGLPWDGWPDVGAVRAVPDDELRAALARLADHAPDVDYTGPDPATRVARMTRWGPRAPRPPRRAEVPATESEVVLDEPMPRTALFLQVDRCAPSDDPGPIELYAAWLRDPDGPLAAFDLRGVFARAFTTCGAVQIGATVAAVDDGEALAVDVLTALTRADHVLPIEHLRAAARAEILRPVEPERAADTVRQWQRTGQTVDPRPARVEALARVDAGRLAAFVEAQAKVPFRAWVWAQVRDPARYAGLARRVDPGETMAPDGEP